MVGVLAVSPLLLLRLPHRLARARPAASARQPRGAPRDLAARVARALGAICVHVRHLEEHARAVPRHEDVGSLRAPNLIFELNQKRTPPRPSGGSRTLPAPGRAPRRHGRHRSRAREEGGKAPPQTRPGARASAGGGAGPSRRHRPCGRPASARGARGRAPRAAPATPPARTRG